MSFRFSNKTAQLKTLVKVTSVAQRKQKSNGRGQSEVAGGEVETEMANIDSSLKNWAIKERRNTRESSVNYQKM